MHAPSRPSPAEPSSAGARPLTLLDCFGLGVNGILGSGIFLLPAALYRRAGGASPAAWLIVGGVCSLVALCFAEAAGRTDRSGGPYRYVCDAFGPRIGFAVGWITLISSLLGYAAVARGFAEHAAWLLGGARSSVVIVLVAGLAVLNIRGLRPSAHASDFVAAIKLLGLGAFIAVGLFHVHAAPFHAPPAPAPGELGGLFGAAFAGLFACTGFEYVPVPAGETHNPQKVIGLAMVISVAAATLLYAIVQIVTVGTAPDLAHAETPLVDAARAFAGPAGATGIAVVALFSAFGFCATSALVVPRYVESFAQDGFLPSVLGRRGRHGTPAVAVVTSSVLVAVMAVLLSFTPLADVSNIAVVVQYVATCTAILVMRRRLGPSPGFRTPFGPLIPVLAIAGSLAFLFYVGTTEILVSLGLAALGLVIGLATRGRRRPV
jgi:amino acid transporter